MRKPSKLQPQLVWRAGRLKIIPAKKSDPIYSFDLAVARIGAAYAARDALKTDFVLTAGCETFSGDDRI